MVSTTLSLDNKNPASASESRYLISAPAAAAAATSFASVSSSTTASLINNLTVQKFDSSSSLNEKISILFPKCRPKSDINLNPMHNTKITLTTSTTTTTTSSTTPSSIPITSKIVTATITTTSMTSPATSSLSSSESSSAPTKSPNIGTNPFLINQSMINNSSGNNIINNRQFNEKISYYYKSKEDLNYQQQYVPTSLSQYNNSLSKFSSTQKPTSYYHSNPFVVKESHWEQRKRTPNTTPASTVLNSPDLTDSDSRNCYAKNSNHHIRVGRSPVNQTTVMGNSGNGGETSVDGIINNAPDILTPTKSMAVSVADGEVVVFDDIGENWQSLRITDAQSSRLAQQSDIPDRLYESFTDVSRTNKQNIMKIDNNEYLDRNYGGGINDVSDLRTMTVNDESVDNFSGIMGMYMGFIFE